MNAMTGNDAEKVKEARIKTIVLLIGVGLALTTFMVKDQKRDDLREKLQEIESQESIFERESYLRSTPVILASIQKNIAEVGRAIDDLSRVKHVESESRRLAGFYFVLNEAYLFDHQFNAMARLLGALPNPPAKLVNDLNTYRSEIIQITKRVEEAKSSRDWDNFYKNESEMTKKIDVLWNEQDRLGQDCIREANQAKEEIKSRYKMYRMASNILFVVGVGLAFYAKFTGVGIVGD
jgi:hypothetical protein